LLSMARCSFMTRTGGIAPLAFSQRAKTAYRTPPQNVAATEQPDVIKLWMGRHADLMLDPTAEWTDDERDSE
jgi:hypothetical protein